jgi:hypothetical protein
MLSDPPYFDIQEMAFNCTQFQIFQESRHTNYHLVVARVRERLAMSK